MITSWGQIDNSWLGKRVVVRWEDPSLPLADGLNSGIPHEHRGTVERPIDALCVFQRRPDGGGWRNIYPPEHARVQEVTE
jgi:hypothetical protein